MPISVSKMKGKLSCTRDGVECSFVCASQRIYETTKENPQLGHLLRENLKALYRDMTGKEPPTVWPPGITRFEAVEYGGAMDEKKITDTIAQLEITPENTIRRSDEKPQVGWNHG